LSKAFLPPVNSMSPEEVGKLNGCIAQSATWPRAQSCERLRNEWAVGQRTWTGALASSRRPRFLGVTLFRGLDLRPRWRAPHV